MKFNYNKDYFQSLNYVNYLDRKPKYEKLTKEIISILNIFNLTNPDSKILDYGCAVGFLLEGLKSAGYHNISGYDISDWAVEECKKKNLTILNDSDSGNFDIIFGLDVFEHMTDEDIKLALDRFNSDILIFRIPCSVDGNTFHLDVSKRDPTHINCKTKLNWINLFNEIGYNFFLPINSNTIYDTPGVMCYLCFKKSVL